MAWLPWAGHVCVFALGLPQNLEFDDKNTALLSSKRAEWVRIYWTHLNWVWLQHPPVIQSTTAFQLIDRFVIETNTKTNCGCVDNAIHFQIIIIVWQSNGFVNHFYLDETNWRFRSLIYLTLPRMIDWLTIHYNILFVCNYINVE